MFLLQVEDINFFKEYYIHIAFVLSLFLNITGIVSFFRGKRNLRNSQSTALFSIQIEMVKEIMSDLDIVLLKVYDVGYRALKHKKGKEEENLESLFYEYHNLRRGFIRKIHRNKAFIPDKILKEFLNLNYHLVKKYEMTQLPKIDMEAFIIESDKMDLTNKQDELNKTIREYYSIDKLSKETASLIKSSYKEKEE